MKDIELRYYIYNNGYKGEMVYTTLSKFNLKMFKPHIKRSRPMPFTGVLDAAKNKIYEFDYLEFIANSIRVIGEVRYVCENHYNGFRVVSLESKIHSWALSPLFSLTNVPKIVSHRYLKANNM